MWTSDSESKDTCIYIYICMYTYTDTYASKRSRRVTQCQGPSKSPAHRNPTSHQVPPSASPWRPGCGCRDGRGCGGAPAEVPGSAAPAISGRVGQGSGLQGRRVEGFSRKGFGSWQPGVQLQKGGRVAGLRGGGLRVQGSWLRVAGLRVQG